MAIFYHYTGEKGIQGIKQSGLITRGNSPFSSQRLFVCLTTSSDPEGHGLTYGSTITRESANFAEVAKLTNTPPDKDFITLANLRKFRLSIDIENNDPALFHWDDIVERIKTYDPVFDLIQQIPPEYNIDMAIIGFIVSTLYPNGSSLLSDEELFKAHFDIIYGLRPTKENTWWFFEGDIEISRITKVEKMNNNAVYEPFPWDHPS